MTGGWKNLLNTDLHDLCSTLDVVCVHELKNDDRGEACGTYEKSSA